MPRPSYEGEGSGGTIGDRQDAISPLGRSTRRGDDSSGPAKQVGESIFELLAPVVSATQGVADLVEEGANERFRG